MTHPITWAIAGVATYVALRKNKHADSDPALHDGALCDPRDLAKRVAQELHDRSWGNYSRDLMAKFQRQAGLPAHGLYDAETRNALIALGVSASGLKPPHIKGTAPTYFPEAT